MSPQQHLLTAPHDSPSRTVTETRDDGRGGLTVLVHGDVDATGAPTLARELDAAWAGSPATVVVDLTGAFVTASSLAVLFRARNRAQERGAAFRVEGLPGPVVRFMTAMELDLDVAARAGAPA